MKIGIISDIHANGLALIRCLEELNNIGVEKIVSLGDSIGYFPEPELVIEMLNSVKAVCLSGNHEAMLLGRLKLDEEKDKIYGIRKSFEKMPNFLLKEVSGWLPFYIERINGRELLFVHGSPWDPVNEYIYPDSDLSMFRSLNFEAVFIGHTHIPFICEDGKPLIVNVGSCGLPRDNGSLSCFAVYDTDNGRCKIFRIPIDINQLLAKYSNLDISIIQCLKREGIRDLIQIKG